MGGWVGGWVISGLRRDEGARQLVRVYSHLSGGIGSEPGSHKGCWLRRQHTILRLHPLPPQRLITPLGVCI